MDKVTLLVISVGFDDFLSYTLPHNCKLFDATYVLTHPDDKKTQDVATANGCKIVATDVFYKDGAIFNKGAGLRFAQDQIPKEGWLLITDPDILMPTSIRKRIRKNNLDPARLYGAARRIVHNCDIKQYLANRDRNLTHLTNSLIPRFYGKRIPVGYFQLYNLDRYPTRRYSSGFKTCEKSDVYFSLLWSWHEIAWMRKTEVIHLGDLRMNWETRKSERIDGQE